MVEAGPGTGKTRTLVARVLHLLDGGVSPEAILALTFSNKAAEEMRERIAQAAPDAAHRIWMGTFHAFGLELLRKHGTVIGLSVDPPVLDPVDAMFLFERDLATLGLSYYQHLPEPTLYLKSILSAISRAKDELVGPAEYESIARRMRDRATTEDEIETAEKALEVSHVYAVYQARLEREGLLDFGDLIARPVALLRDTANGVRETVRGTYAHVLVDEYQDVNRASAILLRELAGEGRGLWVVGDARQSVYRFRGASPVNMASFATDFAGARLQPLEINYRSQQAVVNVVSRFAEKMPRLPGVGCSPWRAHRKDTDGVVQMEIAESSEAEGDGIARDIERHRSERGLVYRDQAVLGRSHGMLARVAVRLERAQVPILYLGDVFERSEVRDLLALLSLASPGDGRGLVRVARFAEYAIPLADVKVLFALARERDVAFPAALSLAETDETISTDGRYGFARLVTQLDGISYGSEAWSLLVHYLFERSAYLATVLGDATLSGRQRRIAIFQFLQFAYEQRRSAQRGHRLDTDGDPKRSFLRFVRRMAMLSDDAQLRQLPDWASAIDAVRLLTVHASKGLEFPVVFVPALAVGKFPASPRGNSCPTPQEVLGDGRDPKVDHDREEECLLFVAISRARDILCLSRAVTYDAGKRSNPSPLLERLDSILPRRSGSSTVTWPADTQATIAKSTGPSPAPTPLPIYGVRAVETYITCPRKFYYENVLKLGGAREDTAYLDMHRCVHEVLRWMIAESEGGRVVAQQQAVSRLEDAWQRSGPCDHPYASMYRSAADAMITRAVQDVTSRTGATSRPDWTVTRSHGRVTVTPDSVELMVEGGATTATVRRVRTGRPSSRESDKPIYALLHTAAAAAHPNANVRVEIAYIATGETEIVEISPKSLQTRVGKYDAALVGIAGRDYRPKPDEFECPRCSHYFICPAAEDDSPSASAA